MKKWLYLEHPSRFSIMTAIATATDIPPALRNRHLEALTAWGLFSLHHQYRQLSYMEVPNALPENRIYGSIITDSAGVPNAIFRVSFQLNPNYITAVNSKLWLSVEEMGSVPLGAAFKVD